MNHQQVKTAGELVEALEGTIKAREFMAKPGDSDEHGILLAPTNQTAGRDDAIKFFLPGQYADWLFRVVEERVRADLRELGVTDV